MMLMQANAPPQGTLSDPTRETRKESFKMLMKDMKHSRRDSLAVFINSSFDDEYNRKFSMPELSISDSGKPKFERRNNRKLSFRPPVSLYTERRGSQAPSWKSLRTQSESAIYPYLKGDKREGANYPEKKVSAGELGNKDTTSDKFVIEYKANGLTGHKFVCSCGKSNFILCDTVQTPPPAPGNSQKKEQKKKVSFEEEHNGDVTAETLQIPEPEMRPSLTEVLQKLEKNSSDYRIVLPCCKNIADMSDDDSLEAVMVRQNVIKCLMETMKTFQDKSHLQKEACRSLLKQARQSEATLQYIVANDGVPFLYKTLKYYSENVEIQALLLDLFGYLSSHDECRSHMIKRGYTSDFLTIMSRHENDATIVRLCCAVVGNVVQSEDTARALMYVGGVHTLIDVMARHSWNPEVLQNCCTALGTFSSHDGIRETVADAGVTKVIMTAMTSHLNSMAVQESCTWALAALSRSDYVCRKHLLKYGVLSHILVTMKTYPNEISIQEYGCWALCSIVSIEMEIPDKDLVTAVSMLMDSLGRFYDNVELLEQICFAVNQISVTSEIQNVMMPGVPQLVEALRRYEDNIDLLVNGCRLIGNLAFNENLRRQVEDAGASEVAIRTMLNMADNRNIQNIGCMVLTNLSADVTDNKFRMLKNGGVRTVLQAMQKFPQDENLQLNSLKLLSNLMESDKTCWLIADEGGVKLISKAMTFFLHADEIVMYGCMCLAALPRKGISKSVLEKAESTLLYLQNMSGSRDATYFLCSFYENVLLSENCNMFNSEAMARVRSILTEFSDSSIQMVGANIIAQFVIDNDNDLFDGDLLSVLTQTMARNISESTIQIIGLSAISYLCHSAKHKSLLRTCNSVDAVIQSMTSLPNDARLVRAATLALECLSQAGLLDSGQLASVCRAVLVATSGHSGHKDIETSVCNVIPPITATLNMGVPASCRADCLLSMMETVRGGKLTAQVCHVLAQSMLQIIKADWATANRVNKGPGLNAETEIMELISEHLFTSTSHGGDGDSDHQTVTTHLPPSSPFSMTANL